MMSRWFVVKPGWTARVECDFRVGGAYRVEMDKQDGTFGVAFGEYLEINPPHRLVFTWSTHSPDVRHTRVEIELRAAGELTELTLSHHLLPDSLRADGHRGGWEGSLRHLEEFLRDQAAKV